MGTYADTTGLSACLACPAGTYSPNSGATALSTCLACPTGTYSPNSGATALSNCLACPKGTYADTTGLSACNECSPGQYTDTVGSTSVSSCKQCPDSNPVFNGVSCTICPPDQYYEDNICNPCPANNLIYDTDLGVCLPIPSGTNFTTVQRLTVDKNQPSMSDFQLPVSNDNGFTLFFNIKLQQNIGTTGATLFTDKDWYNFTIVLINNYIVLIYQDFPWANFGRLPVGEWTRVAIVFDKASHTFRSYSGLITELSGVTYVLDPSKNMDYMFSSYDYYYVQPAFSWNFDDMKNNNIDVKEFFYFDKPFTQPELVSVMSPLKCPPGTSIVFPDLLCQPCSLGTYSNTINQRYCTEVPSNSSSNAKNTDFVCNPGYIRSNGNSCINLSCPFGTYRVIDTCTQLPLNSTVTSDGVDFTCNPGWYREDTTCLQKATGGTITYDDNYVLHSFTASGTFTPTNADLYVDILVVGQGGDNRGNGGTVYYQSGLKLGAQTYSVSINSSQSLFGTIGSSSGLSNSTGSGAGGPAGSWGRGPGITYNISGNEVEYGRGGGNSSLSGGANTGNGGDVGMSGGSGVVYVRYLKTPCLTGNVWDSVSTRCMQTCPATEPFNLGGICTTCNPPNYLYNGGCVSSCPLNMYGQKGTCVECPFNKKTVSSGSTSVKSCLCDVNTYGLSGELPCDNCPSNYVSSIGAATTINMCTISCPSGTYASGANCLSCPDPTTDSPAGSVSISACKCPNSNLLSGSSCVSICPTNTYADSVNKICTACSGSQISSLGSTTVNQCLCPSGTYGRPGSGTCTACTGNKISNGGHNGCVCPVSTAWDSAAQWCVTTCPENTYQTAGSKVCTSCPANKRCPAGSTRQTDCSCTSILEPYFNGSRCVQGTSPRAIPAGYGGFVRLSENKVMHSWEHGTQLSPPGNDFWPTIDIDNAEVILIGAGADGTEDGGAGTGGQVVKTTASFKKNVRYSLSGGAGQNTTLQAHGVTLVANKSTSVTYGSEPFTMQLYTATDPNMKVCNDKIFEKNCFSGDNIVSGVYDSLYPNTAPPSGATIISQISARGTTSDGTDTPRGKVAPDGCTINGTNCYSWQYVYDVESYLKNLFLVRQTASYYNTFGIPRESNYEERIGEYIYIPNSLLPWKQITRTTPQNWPPMGAGGNAGWVSTGIDVQRSLFGTSGGVIIIYPTSTVACPSELPFYDYELAVPMCTTCLLYNYMTPVFEPSTGLCTSCPEGTIWDGNSSSCVASCPESLPLINPTKNTCVKNTPSYCPASMPYWNDYDCANSQLQISRYGGALGGDKIVNNGTYILHTFTTSGIFTPLVNNLPIDVLVVGGGGGGGQGLCVTATTLGAAGGGGGGQVKYLQQITTSYRTSYQVTVGNGGQVNQNGTSSSFQNFGTSYGGQAGGSCVNPDVQQSLTNIGSGGGGGAFADYVTNTTVKGLGGTTLANQGSYGSNSNVLSAWYTSIVLGGGGGGAGGTGSFVSFVSRQTSGGNGASYDMSGVSSSRPKYYGSGGGGEGYRFYRNNARTNWALPISAIIPTIGKNLLRGGGGDGGDANANGSNGVVIIRYPVGNACPGDLPYFNPTTSLCTLCPSNLPSYNLSTGSCEACSGGTPYWNGFECVATCPPLLPHADSNNICIGPCVNQAPIWDPYNKTCVRTCPTTYPVNNNGTCQSCSDGLSWNNETKTCGTCPEQSVNSVCILCRDIDINNPYWNGSSCTTCPGGGSVHWNGSSCTTCPDNLPIYISATNSCSTCYGVNRLLPLWNGSQCTTCPPATPIWNGTTLKCDTCYNINKTLPYWDGSQCTTCPNSWILQKSACVPVSRNQVLTFSLTSSVTSTTDSDNNERLYIVGSTTGDGWKAFDKNSSTYWQVSTSSYIANTPYVGRFGIKDRDGISYTGEYFRVQFPYQYIPLVYTFTSSVDAPKSWILFGSNDRKSWHLLDSRTDVVNLNQTFSITNNSEYSSSFSTYIFMITKSSGTRPSVSEFELYSIGDGTDILSTSDTLERQYDNALNSSVFAGCSTNQCIVQKASEVDISNLVYSKYMPTEVPTKNVPSPFIDRLNECSSNVECTGISLNFEDASVYSFDIPGVLFDTSQTTIQNSGVFTKPEFPVPLITYGILGFVYNVYGTLQGTQAGTSKEDVSKEIGCAKRCSSNPSCTGFNFSTSSNACTWYTTITDNKVISDPNFDISYLINPRILTGDGTTVDEEVRSSVKHSKDWGKLYSCMNDVSKLIDLGYTTFSSRDLLNCSEVREMTVKKVGTDYHVTLWKKRQLYGYNNYVLNGTVTVTRDPKRFINQTYLSYRDQNFVTIPDINGRPYTIPAGVILGTTGTPVKQWYKDSLTPINFVDKSQYFMIEVSTGNTEKITLYNVSSTPGPDILAKNWIDKQAYVIVSDSTSRVYSAGNPGMYEIENPTYDQANGRNPNYSIFYFTRLGGLDDSGALWGFHKFLIRSIGTYNSGVLYNPWLSGTTLPAQGTGNWHASSGTAPPQLSPPGVYQLIPY
jgi:hypothetical protein